MNLICLKTERTQLRVEHQLNEIGKRLIIHKSQVNQIRSLPRVNALWLLQWFIKRKEKSKSHLKVQNLRSLNFRSQQLKRLSLKRFKLKRRKSESINNKWNQNEVQLLKKDTIKDLMNFERNLLDENLLLNLNSLTQLLISQIVMKVLNEKEQNDNEFKIWKRVQRNTLNELTLRLLLKVKILLSHLTLLN